VAALIGSGCQRVRQEPAFASPANPTSSSTVSNRFIELGDPQFFGLYLPDPRREVRLVRAEMMDVPDGVTINGVWAINTVGKGGSVGAARGAQSAAELRPQFRPVGEVVLDPRRPSEWYLVVECHLTRSGDFTIPGYRLTYELDGRRRSQVFDRRQISLHTGEKPD